MADKPWKRRERAVAALLGGRRIPVTGIDRHGADVVADALAVQVKHGRRRPAFLRDWLDGIRTSAARAGKTGLVVWTTPGEATGDGLALLAVADLAALLSRHTAEPNPVACSDFTQQSGTLGTPQLTRRIE